ncbi:hypothetical protein ANN_06640 [Periplaneta americana]|uniref:Uncharacterized protein n=1 Tax=Periplaneta americana TaxID=6978 RepID=A0ABQ8TFX4_PERAM|nr:hypothetical protein ANN_06640 [Periplaneta americana]
MDVALGDHLVLQDCDDYEDDNKWILLARMSEIFVAVATRNSRYLASEWNEGDNAGEMSPGSITESHPAFARIGLRETPGKSPEPESFEDVEKFRYLGATITNINDTREEIKRRINMGNAYYYSIEKLLSSSLLSKYLKVRIYKTVILPVVLYGCETWTLTLREEQRLRLFENKVLRKIFVAKRDEVTGELGKLHNVELYALYSSSDIIRNIKSNV